IREHSGNFPAATQFPRPRKLHVGLHSRAGDGLVAGRQTSPECCGKVDLSRYRTNLPFDRRCYIRESRIERIAHGGEISRKIDQKLQAGPNTPAESAVRAIELVGAVLLAKIDAVLTLETTLRHHQT